MELKSLCPLPYFFVATTNQIKKAGSRRVFVVSTRYYAVSLICYIYYIVLRHVLHCTYKRNIKFSRNTRN